MIGLVLCTDIVLDLTSSSGLHTQFKLKSRHHIQNFEDTRLQDWITAQAQQKDSSSTLDNYDGNCTPQTLSSKEGMKGIIPIRILNIFGYRTNDPIVQIIHLHS